MPSKLEILRQLALRQKGAYGAQRVERAADEIKNLTKLYSSKALDAAFLGDNAKALMTMNPKDFERYAAPLTSRTPTDIGKLDPKLVKSHPSLLATDDYIKYLQKVKGGFNDVPFLEINKEEQGLPLIPFISGHEGRHRNRAMAASGEQAGLVRLEPRAELREPFPRRSQEEYIEALRQELGMTGNKVVPQGGYEGIDLPPIYKQGGEVSQDAMRMAVMNQKVQHKAVGGVPNPIGVKKTVMKIFGRDVPIVSNDKASINKAIASGIDPRDIAFQFRNRDKENQEQNLRMLNKILGQSPEARVMIPQKNLGSSGLKESQPYEVPPPLPRAKNMPKKELLARAQGVAAQRNNEFVRDPLRTELSIDTTGRSKKEFERQKTLQHDIRPKFNDGITPATVDYSKHKDDVLIGIKGDPTPTDVMIHRVNDTQLTDPVESEGGPLYALRKAMKAWASNYTAASGVQNLVNTASQQYGGRGVLGQYIKMGPDSYSYAQHFADTALNMFDPSKYTPQQIDAINNFFRQGYLKKGERIAFPEFAGIENPTLASLQMQADPNLRKFFGDTLQIPKQANALGLPSGKDIAHALTEPDLRNLETGITGKSVMQMEPGVFILQPSSSKTYDTDIGRKANTPLMQSEVPMPYDLTFPDTVAQIRATPEQRGAREFGSLGMVGARQIMDPQWQDQINTYTDYIKRYTGKKKGGAVHMAGGSLVDDLISDAKKKQSAPVNPSRMQIEKQSQYEKDVRQYQASQQEARERLFSDRIPSSIDEAKDKGIGLLQGAGGALAGYAAQIPGFVGDIASIFDESQSIPTTERIQQYYFPEDKTSPEFQAGMVGGNAAALAEGVTAIPAMVRGAGKGAKALGREAAFRIHQAMTTGEGPLAGALASVAPRRIFIGEKSALYDHSGELAAKAMAAAGKTPDDIWAQTRTIQGADGKWRQEISDKNSKFFDAAAIKSKADAAKEFELAIKQKIADSKVYPDLFPKQLMQAQKELRGQAKASKASRTSEFGLEADPELQGNSLDIALDHPTLYDAYPELRKVIVNQGGYGGDALGQLTTAGGSSAMDIFDAGLKKDPRSTALHEAQHAIQGIERWSPGGSSRMAFQNKEAFDILKDMRAKAKIPLPFDVYAKDGGWDNPLSAKRDYDKYVKGLKTISPEIDRVLQGEAAKMYYKRLAGETEARAVQDRMDFTDAQLSERPPSTDYEFQINDQIVKPPFKMASGGEVTSDDLILEERPL